MVLVGRLAGRASGCQIYARMAQLVEHLLAKERVAGSSPVLRSDGVWLSLARAPDLGSGGRRFESCHPD